MTRQPDFSTAPRVSRPPAWQPLALAACALVAVVSLGAAWQARQEAADARRRAAEVRREAEAAAERARTLLARSLARQAGMLAPDEASPARILADVAGALPGQVRLERLAIDYRRGGVLELAVVAKDASAWDLLLQQLELARHIREVVPGPEAREAEVRSLVRARWQGEPR